MRKRRHQKIYFLSEPCRRGCGKILTTTNRSTLGLELLKKKYELICSDCLTEPEKQEMLERMGGEIIKRA